LVLVVERGAAALLRWSSWRRWHQAWARYHHYRRREGAAPARHPSAEAVQHAPVRQIAVTDVVWRRLEALLPPTHRVGHPYDYSRRLILDAIVHVMQTDCGWRNLPSRFPPWQTVYTQLTQWRKTGIWAKIWAGLDQPHPTDELQL
jgi:transposase